jgi:hypothetical protein
MAEGSAARMDEISQSLPKRRERRVSNEKGRYDYVLAGEMIEDWGRIWGELLFLIVVSRGDTLT